MLRIALRLRLVALAAALAVVALIVSGCSGGSDAVDQAAGGQYRYVGATTRGHVIAEQDRKSAGDATAPYVSTSGTWELSKLKGQVAVLNYWGTWCPPCVVETPQFDKIYRAVKSQGVIFVGMTVKDDSQSRIKAFITDNDISYPIVFDPTAKTAIEIGHLPALDLPSTVLIDRQGRVAAVYVGQLAAGDLEPVLTMLAAET